MRYLAQARDLPEARDFSDAAVGEMVEQGRQGEAFLLVDKILRRLGESGKEYKVEPLAPAAAAGFVPTWERLRELAGQGHEIADHTVSHAYLPLLDTANILYEIEKCREDLLAHLGPRHTLSIECPYGIEDGRVLALVDPEFPFVRNGISDKFIKEILRGDPGEPASADREYVQWQRGPLADTPLNEMTGWIDTAIKNNVWLLLVFHGVEGVGWEALPGERLKIYFNYIKARDARLWTATFQDAFKYVRERMNAKVESNVDADAISVSISHGLDPRIYDLPLTLRTAVPYAWKTVDLRQGAKKIILPVQKRGEAAFVLYRALPNADKIFIAKNE